MSEVKDREQQQAPAKQQAPTPEKQRAKLDRWEYDGVRLHGIVYDHPRLPDGKPVSTSRVTWIDLAMKIAETRNTVYILLRKAT